MTSRTAMSPELTLDYLDIAPQDRAGCLGLLNGPAGPAVQTVFDHLASRLGSADGPVPELDTAELPATELDWLSAMLRFTPELLAWQAGRNIPDAVSRATLADMGRNMAINRRVHHRFGMDTCCGGGVTVDEAARRDGIEVGVVWAALHEAIGAS